MRFLPVLLVLVVIVIAAATVKETAPTTRIGFTSPSKIFDQLPEAQQARVEMDSFQRAIQQELTSRVGVLEEKHKKLEQERASLNKFLQQEREAELASLNEALEKFRASAKEALLEKEKEIVMPIYEKTQQAIDAVAKEHHFTHILNVDARSETSLLLYADESTRIDKWVVEKLLNDQLRSEKKN
jgi:outer membrane protein